MRLVSPSQFEEAIKFASISWRNRQEKTLVVDRLCELVKPPPKRPLYYATDEICHLPGVTRDSIRYLGDYVDLLTKEMTFEFCNGKGRYSSLAANVKRLEKLPEFTKLSAKLQRYSDFIYTPGKHDFSLPAGRRHRFTAGEVILTAFITMSLAAEIRSVSKFAEEAARENTMYSIGGKWGSADRVRYEGREE